MVETKKIILKMALSLLLASPPRPSKNPRKWKKWAFLEVTNQLLKSAKIGGFEKIVLYFFFQFTCWYHKHSVKLLLQLEKQRSEEFNQFKKSVNLRLTENSSFEKYLRKMTEFSTELDKRKAFFTLIPQIYGKHF